jgi:hypothetical protein
MIMRDTSVRQNPLPIGATLLLLLGALLIAAGVVDLFVGHPNLGGQNGRIYEILMGGGAVCVLLGTWISRQWYKGRRSQIS